MRILQQLWNDELGVVVSAELILVLTILVIGMIVGLTSLRDQVVQELGDVAAAISQVNQSYSISGITGHHSQTQGSIFVDFPDSCDAPPDVPGVAPVCILICDVPAVIEGTPF